ncbi:MAG: polymer-forming cytoskeletal protein [Gemmatimonadaceae bacterium]|nr:polymer-forming cytoskeletal protein [Gemmatimonadaceae bacterium]
MAIWKDQPAPKKDDVLAVADTPINRDAVTRTDPAPRVAPAPVLAPALAQTREPRESLIASEITIEGKIEGTGHVRLAGRFKGDVQVQGNLSIERGAKLTGGVRASTVVIGGELEGNITEAARVELLDSGVLNGDLKAGSLTVAAGSRMRGQVEFGWEDAGATAPAIKLERGAMP